MDVAELHDLRREGRHEEALTLALRALESAPDDAELRFELACLHDYLGREAEAVPHYRAALQGRLAASSRRQALLGLGSTLRTLGRYAEAHEVLAQGVAEFPDAAEIQVFLAMALHNLGRGKEALELALRLLAANSADAEIRAYRRAIELYAQDLDRAWT